MVRMKRNPWEKPLSAMKHRAVKEFCLECKRLIRVWKEVYGAAREIFSYCKRCRKRLKLGW